MSEEVNLQKTPLNNLHKESGAKLVPFAGWEMPIQYEPGVIAEHTWCRTSAAFFDVSHMATIEFWGDNVADELERLTPMQVSSLAEGRQRYGVLTNSEGGIVDDYMLANWGDHYTMVANASRRREDLAFLQKGLNETKIVERTDLALIALQGPKAAQVLEQLTTDLAGTKFLDVRNVTFSAPNQPEILAQVSRSGYTGEDGFEIAVASDQADMLGRALLADEAVKPAGLGARDTLRLEAGLCLYGNDLNEQTTPVEANIG